ncbi:hypothetical protein NDU88_000857 [Pleurodeles waltl]|uniref:Uncharacterized protein n=1 Tax=Pleurodeles waltl TaxID=8319 RepID=A0AAV7L7S8_PLEWA|nr:hypothetical protein NDU88_000857 [Pleurodeles waltl]
MFAACSSGGAAYPGKSAGAWGRPRLESPRCWGRFSPPAAREELHIRGSQLEPTLGPTKARVSELVGLFSPPAAQEELHIQEELLRHPRLQPRGSLSCGPACPSDARDADEHRRADERSRSAMQLVCRPLASPAAAVLLQYLDLLRPPFLGTWKQVSSWGALPNHHAPHDVSSGKREPADTASSICARFTPSQGNQKLCG